MPDLKDLRQKRNDILKAELAAWLHNIGKLDPNFLVMQTEESPDILGIYRIPGQYSFKRFCKPTVLISQFPYENFKGPLFFPDLKLGKQIEEVRKKISQLQSLPPNSQERRKIGELQQKLINLRDQKQRAEESLWNNYEDKIERCILSISQSWPLGSLLTMFWESEWFERPNLSSYEPGSHSDPDYQRVPKSGIQLKKGLTMNIPAFLLLAHGEVSGQEKKGFDSFGHYIDVADYHGRVQKLKNLCLSSVFGFEKEIDWENWSEKRRKIFDTILTDWNNPLVIKQKFPLLFSILKNALGDTQRPINEITLWDYSASTAALFKSIAIKILWEGVFPQISDMRWRLLSIRLNAWDFLFQSQQIADLVARKRMLNDVYKVVEHILETEYPIGAKIYSDEHGLVFVIPEIRDLSKSEIKKKISSLIDNYLYDPSAMETFKEQVSFYGIEDIKLSISIGNPQRGKRIFLTEVLKKPPVSAPEPKQVKEWWSKVENKNRCSLCGLRPIGYVEDGLPNFVSKRKAEERMLCGVCLARRGRRSEEWATQESDATIWLDEVADYNGRIGLIVAKFDIEHWLSGKLVRSLAIGTDSSGNWLAKPPTFARIQRVWRTTAEFWKEVNKELAEKFRDDRRRILFYLNRFPPLGEYHAYELNLDGISIEVAWVPEKDGREGHLISICNLQYVAKQLGASKDIFKDPVLSSIFVEDFIREKVLSSESILHNPEAKIANKSQNLLKGYRIVKTDFQDTAYATYIPILAEPRTFMALVPANKAFEVVKAIKTKYEREIGRVRNRLPLHLGIVFADSHQPLRTILDAGRRMLKRNSLASIWEVKKVKQFGEPNNPNETKGWRALSLLRYSDLIKQHPNQFRALIGIRLENKWSCRDFTWFVPAVMGDGQTEDHWYPYVYWVKDKEGNTEPDEANRSRYYQAPNPFDLDENNNPKPAWLVHAAELEPGDIIYFTPATFDFLWLGHGGDRFRLAYDKEGRRLGTLHRPYLLDELEELERCWRLLAGEKKKDKDGKQEKSVKRLSSRQLHQVRDLIEGKRAEWFENPESSVQDSTFRSFCEDVLRNAEWTDEPTEKELENLTQWAVNGLLADAVELFYHIMKERPLKDDQG